MSTYDDILKAMALVNTPLIYNAPRGMGKTTLMDISSMYPSTMWGHKPIVSKPMLYGKAFAELTRLKKEQPGRDHKIVKINKSQFVVESFNNFKPGQMNQLKSRGLRGKSGECFIIDFESDFVGFEKRKPKANE